MLKRWIAASALLAVLLAPGGRLAQSDPKPGRFQIELYITSKGIALKFGVIAPESEPTPALDAFLPAYVDQWLQHMGDAVAQPGRWAGYFGQVTPFHRWLKSGLRDPAEESGAEDPEAVYREIRNRSVELGLVETAY